MSVRQELEKIRAKHRGILRPKHVVAFAANPETALHKRFVWDDTVAAQRWRIHQARQLINFVMVRTKECRPVNAYVSLTTERASGNSYRSIEDVMSDASLRRRFIGQALAEAEAWRIRYERFVEFTDIFSAIRKTRTKLAR